MEILLLQQILYTTLPNWMRSGNLSSIRLECATKQEKYGKRMVLLWYLIPICIRNLHNISDYVTKKNIYITIRLNKKCKSKCDLKNWQLASDYKIVNKRFIALDWPIKKALKYLHIFCLNNLCKRSVSDFWRAPLEKFGPAMVIILANSQTWYISYTRKSQSASSLLSL